MSKSMLWPSSRSVAEMPEIDSSADAEMLDKGWMTVVTHDLEHFFLDITPCILTYCCAD